ncbi:MAG: hypothetical protein EAZ92_02045 [Candidatus Kapaibacterium sp.]|nr:MAG: hypothetical protein EAZ92_02045 [Candidatus Kapabacteria bacterium]
MHLSLNLVRRFRVSTLAVLAFTAVCWCGILGIIDNEGDSSLGFFQCYFDPIGSFLYGVPVLMSGLWLVARLERRGYSQRRALRWAVPLSCLLGTVFALVLIACGLGVYVLLNGRLR